jgi:hypothetical protein
VQTAFTTELLDYCTRMGNGPRIDLSILDVRVTVVTAWPVPGLRADLGPRARRILSRELPSAQLDRVFFAVNERLPAPHYQIEVQGWPRQLAEPDHRGNGHREPAYPVLVLTLAYESDHQFVYPLAVTPLWLEIRRGPAAQDHRHEIPLPNHLNAVPAGALLQLRYWQGRVELRRAPVKPHYLVQVDGHWLAPGQQVQIAYEGWIAYARDGRRTVLDYLLKERE